MKQFAVTISMDSNADVLYACLNKIVQESHSTMSVEMMRDQRNQLEFRCLDHVQHTTQTEKNWTYELAQVISKFIVDHMEFFLLRRILLNLEAAYEEHEINEIVNYCKQLLTDIEAGLGSEERTRQNEICTQLFKYLRTNSTLNVDGFIHFRLKRYLNDLQDVVADAQNEFKLNEQYQEFIALLKYFVYFQDAKIPEVHLIHHGNNKFQLLDGDLQQLDISGSKDVIVETVDRELNYEDMVVSALIAASPKTIYIHTRDPGTQAIRTIQQIFEGRTWICTCCELCESTLGEWKAERLT